MDIIGLYGFLLFVTAASVLFLKLKWPKSKNFCKFGVLKVGFKTILVWFGLSTFSAAVKSGWNC